MNLNYFSIQINLDQQLQKFLVQIEAKLITCLQYCVITINLCLLLIKFYLLANHLSTFQMYFWFCLSSCDL